MQQLGIRNYASKISFPRHFAQGLGNNTEAAFTDPYSASTIVTLAKRFPQMGLSDSWPIAWGVNRLIPVSSDYPEIAKYKSADSTWRLRSGKFCFPCWVIWWQDFCLSRFQMLIQRVFSILGKSIQTRGQAWIRTPSSH